MKSPAEMSTQFDVMFNNITSNQAPGVDEFEKSIFLTKAASMLVIEFFNNRTDGVGGGFDGSQKRQYDFSSLIKTAQLSAPTTTVPKLDDRSLLVAFHKDYFLSVSEKVTIKSPSTGVGTQYTVIPLTYVEYQRLMLKPYQLPVKRAVWRLLTNTETLPTAEPDSKPETVPVAEIIGYKISEAVIDQDDPSTQTTNPPATAIVYFKLRYIPKLKPIILEDLDNGLTIDGETEASLGSLPEECHQEILERAVTLAKIAWQGGTLTQAQAQAQRNRNNDD
jgi:hypothetical protein